MLPLVESSMDWMEWIDGAIAEPKPHKCPVCEGVGGIQYGGKPKGVVPFYLKTPDMKINVEPCHGCDGKGWVVV